MWAIVLKIVLGIGLVFLGWGSSHWGPFKDKPDNIAEEICEEVIHNQTGLDIDLTPDSPEMISTSTEKKDANK